MSFRKYDLGCGILFLLLSFFFPPGVGAEDVVKSPDPAAYSCPDCNVIFISITNLRADHLSLYGYDRETAPALADFAKKATVFDEAFTVASWTVPPAISIFTSLYPFQHRVMARVMDAKTKNVGVVQNKLDDRVLTLFDVLKQHGYHTATINGGAEYSPRYGLTGRADFGVSYSPIWGKDGSAFDVIPEAIRWLGNNHNKKFFLQIQAFDPHCPYGYLRENKQFDPTYKGDADFTRCYWTIDKVEAVTNKEKNGAGGKSYVLNSPDEYSLRSRRQEYGASCAPDDCPASGKFLFSDRDLYHMVALYDGVIHNVDSQLKDLFATLKELDLLKKTIIVFFSEHGDSFGKNGRFMRPGTLRGIFYEDVLHVPLIVYHPQLPARRIASPVSLIDIAPSVLEALRIPVPDQFQGESFLPLFSGKEKKRDVYAGCVYVPNETVVRKALRKDPTTQGLSEYFQGSSVVTVVRGQQMKLIRETVIIPLGYAGSKNPQIETLYELYDLAHDPQESRNLKDKLPEIVKQLDANMNAWFYSTMGQEYNSFIDRIKQGLSAGTGGAK